jgi:hypothetical protein
MKSHNMIIKDVVRIGTMIMQTTADIAEGLKSSNYSMFTEPMEQLANIDIDTNTINNKIVSSIPVFCKDEQTAREFVSYVRIITKFAQTAHAMRYFCKNITDYINECLKDNVSQLFQTSMDAFDMALGLIKNNSNIKNTFRMIKTEQMKCDELLAQIERNITGFDMKLALDYIKIVNILGKIGFVSKNAVAIAKIVVLTQDGGELRIY